MTGTCSTELELDKDVEIPFGNARLEFDPAPGFGYGVMDVYGLCESFFNSKVELVNED